MDLEKIPGLTYPQLIMNLKAGYPFSLIKNGLVAEYPKLGKNINTDVIVLGGGISGALTAWNLR